MKTIIPLFALMFLAGCGKNSVNPSGTTNSVPDKPPAASNNNTNRPMVETTGSSVSGMMMQGMQPAKVEQMQVLQHMPLFLDGPGDFMFEYTISN